MCRICGKYRCPPGCPEFDGTSVERGKQYGFCLVCDKPVYEQEAFRWCDGGLYCTACADRLFSERDTL